MWRKKTLAGNQTNIYAVSNLEKLYLSEGAAAIRTCFPVVSRGGQSFNFIRSRNQLLVGLRWRAHCLGEVAVVLLLIRRWHCYTENMQPDTQ